MPTITISDDAYAALTRKAAAVGVSPDEFIALTLNGEGTLPPPPGVSAVQVLEGEAWWKAFEELQREVQSRAHLYPPGFQLDVSREAIYPDSEDGR